MKQWIERFYEEKIFSYLKENKVIILHGARRTGKTSLLEKISENLNEKYFWGNCDDINLREILQSEDLNKIKSFFSEYKTIILDEAQRVKNIGLALKILVDNIKGIKIIASGSSSFKLLSNVGEPLTGRSIHLTLFPISILELKKQFGPFFIIENLEDFLIYGTYPEILTVNNQSDKKEYLINLRNSYLLKDILELENIRNSDKIFDLLRLIAFQIGKEVSLNELSSNLNLSKQTVARYLDLLEKSHIIKKVRGFSRNLRKEITKTSRYYFIDNGIRNAIIMNFNYLKNRNDQGMLWENFLFTERVKKLTYQRIFSNIYFWRTHDKKEIDFVEEREGKLYGFEFKWGKRKTKPPKLWFETYKEAEFEEITKDNFLEFLT